LAETAENACLSSPLELLLLTAETLYAQHRDIHRGATLETLYTFARNYKTVDVSEGGCVNALFMNLHELYRKQDAKSAKPLYLTVLENDTVHFPGEDSPRQFGNIFTENEVRQADLKTPGETVSALRRTKLGYLHLP